ncbi:mechanosensitive ion channel family protein [Metabacillus fastidiosus]|uniref:mechanosensitive ion channel family protein n=1 Tax=Metabacillus fastidiosus TaxID=1458 RepID=UPI003D2D835F
MRKDGSLFNLEKFNWEGLLVNASIITLKVIGVLIAFTIVKAVGRKVMDQTFKKMMGRKEISEGRALTLHKLAENIFSYALIFILIATLFNIFGLSVASLIAGAGIVGLAIGFGAQGLVSDVVTGFFLLLEKQIDVGDYITVGSFDGIVESVGLRTTQIRSFNGTLNYIPNREIKSVSNHSRGNMRALVDIEISSNDNIDKAIDIMQQVCDRIAKENPLIVDGPNVIGVQSLGSSNTVIRIIAKTENMEQWAVEREIRKAIKEVLDEHRLDISLSKPGENSERSFD